MSSAPSSHSSPAPRPVDPGSAWRVVRSRAAYEHVGRVIRALGRQPEYREIGGTLAWWALRLATPLIYCFRLRQKRPLIISIERGGEVRGSLTFTRSGQIANAVALGEGDERRTVVRRLLAEVDRELAAHDRAWYVRTFETNRSARAALERRAFARVPHSEYVVTLPLGPLTFSWLQSRPPRQR
ncbi:MAG: hypothetical protein H0V51_09185, partial [Chloroflexi bacterium]|nr:hypothetical protein [Chloroflexota bacterium]